MKIALFLDVDITLTTDYIQDVFAKELGVEKAYLAIEREFQETKDSEKFGSALSGLFAAHKFTKAMAHALFDKVNLRSYVGPVFALQKQGVDIYLVSSGPNYYIEVSADNMEVPLDRKICSRYEFEGPRAFSGLTESAGFSRSWIYDSPFVSIRHGDCDGQAIFSGLA
jgi:phosphoserine phosphatase